MLVSFDAVLMMCEMFTFMWTSVNFGVLTITLVQMMVDLSLFAIFFSVVLVGFCLALLGLSETSTHEHHLVDDTASADDPASAVGRVFSTGRRMLSSALRAPAFALAGESVTSAASLAVANAPAATAAAAAAAAAAARPAAAMINATALDGGRSLAEGAVEDGDASSSNLLGGSSVWSALDAMGSDFTNHEVSASAPTIELGLVYQPFWAMFAEFDLDELAKVPFGLPLMWVYVLIANIVLVNMLIAMFSDTYARIKKNALIEYHFQHYMYIFEYQYVVRTLPAPFNFPLLLWDSCVSMCRSREHRKNLARMHLDDGYDEDPNYGAPAGVDGEEGLSMMRKYVQRYLQAHTDQVRDSSVSSLAKRMETTVFDLEERMMHEFEHIHNSLIAPMGSGAKVEQKLRHISHTIDRFLKGERGEAAAAAAAGTKKDEVRAAQLPSNLVAAAPPNGHAQPNAPPVVPKTDVSSAPSTKKSNTNRSTKMRSG